MVCFRTRRLSGSMRNDVLQITLGSNLHALVTATMETRRSTLDTQVRAVPSLVCSSKRKDVKKETCGGEAGGL